MVHVPDLCPNFFARFRNLSVSPYLITPIPDLGAYPADPNSEIDADRDERQEYDGKSDDHAHPLSLTASAGGSSRQVAHGPEPRRGRASAPTNAMPLALDIPNIRPVARFAILVVAG